MKNGKYKFDLVGYQWFKDDKLHKEDGPAVQYATGTKFWFYEGKKHRIDGPAIEFASGHKEWFFNGKRIKCSSLEEFKRLIKLKVFW